jgi:hypothetical protein
MLMWKIDAQTGTRTLVPTLSLRQHTRKLRNKLNKSNSASGYRISVADLPRERACATARGGESYAESLTPKGEAR